MTKPTTPEDTQPLLPLPSGGGTHNPSVGPLGRSAEVVGKVASPSTRGRDDAAGSPGLEAAVAQPPATVGQPTPTRSHAPEQAGLISHRPVVDASHAEAFALAAEIDIVVCEALAEDIGAGDMTTDAVIGAAASATADLVVKETGVLCGLQVARATFSALDADFQFEESLSDGSRLAASRTVVATVGGSARALLSSERTALNLVGRLSGIASLTRRFVDAVEGTDAVILDTRKTTPRLRALEKYAVRCGGGQNHRFGLFDAALIKENHVRLAGGLAVAVERVRGQTPDAWIEVEVENLAELDEALDLAVDRIMLDNMAPEQMAEAVALTRGRVELEASGGITLENVRAVAETGVDFISVGALTRSARSLDVSLEVR